MVDVRLPYTIELCPPCVCEHFDGCISSSEIPMDTASHMPHAILLTIEFMLDAQFIYEFYATWTPSSGLSKAHSEKME